MAEKTTSSDRENTKPPVWEWILAALGVVLVGAAIGSTLFRAVTHEASPPSFEISVDSITPSVNGFVVAFRVKNTGSQTAASLNIEADLMKGAEKVETSAATLAYAPANSERRGGLFFTKDPRAFELQIRALGYERP